jgi:hypothetical protein
LRHRDPFLFQSRPDQDHGPATPRKAARLYLTAFNSAKCGVFSITVTASGNGCRKSCALQTSKWLNPDAAAARMYGSN